jgi:hypothetical protein
MYTFDDNHKCKLGKWRISCLKWLDIMELWHGLHCYWLYQNHISHSVHRFQLYKNAHGFMPKSKLCMWAPVCHVHDGFVECKVIGTIFQRVNEQEYDIHEWMWGNLLDYIYGIQLFIIISVTTTSNLYYSLFCFLYIIFIILYL